MPYVMPFLLAMVVTIAWLPVLARAATRWGIVDKPGIRKVPAIPMPRIGGLAMIVGVLVAAIIVIPLDPNDQYFLIAAGVLAAFGAADDRFDLDYRVKLVGQLLAILIVVVAGDAQIHSITLDERLLLPQWVSIPLTVLFLVGITNAINLADGLDGLAGGTTFLCLGALAMLSHSSGQFVTAALSLAFAGALLGLFPVHPVSGQLLHGSRRKSAARLRRGRLESACDAKRHERLECRDADFAAGAAHIGYVERDGA